ncbi:GNAT family acetyltransferase [Sphingobium herbicidovorans NBRC 16415]|uniref:GNAT family acetyltransferase n=1 Tax=Sphingobium herbicidovorans (strain ATCC 700291 / DSM 11019 / CCUG 56400 / KCTC 2939 / LMG 18315 / NBRC 16415 / MH) TaxID=1219045 RepID=A0A086P7H4_SPHHM|nr:acetyltransferase [Sphingobium herbicidovorans]KFG89342.1 GNAT family acetyltransferase [Sphingobium herbicidovorans NBRC 16415]
MADLADSLVVERVGRDDLSLRALATLRMTVFRSWPYLYEGSLDYEAAYLDEFLTAEDAVVVVARVGDIPVGMATASPMATQSHVIKAPFLAAGAAIDTLFYFGESVLLPQFRGRRIGHRFFDEREAAARAAGANCATFCAVVRQDDDPRRPDGARDLQGFWRNRGYSLAPGYDTQLSWKEVGAAQESEHLMRFWMKRL